MAANPVHGDLQLTGGCGQATAAQTHGSGRQIRHHVNTEQGLQSLGGTGIPHPDGALCQLLRWLKQKPDPGLQGRLRCQHARHAKTNAGVDVVSAGMHDPLLFGRERKTRAFLHRQRIPEEELRVPDPDEAADEIEGEMRRQIDHNLSKGIIRLTGDGHFRYSFRGLFFLWRQFIKDMVRLC